MKETNKYNIIRCVMMVTGVLFISISVGGFRLSAFGVDAFTCMNLGISGFLGMQFGTWQLIMNAMILVVLFFAARHCIGLGTIVNMVCVGYVADFICWLCQDVIQLDMTIVLRVLALVLGMIFAGLGVAFYMVADMGIAPYDAVGVMIEERTGGRLAYDKARVISDVSVVIVGVVFSLAAGNSVWMVVGLGTVCNALFNGPLIQFFKKYVTEPLIKK